jgi:hypothetical protein
MRTDELLDHHGDGIHNISVGQDGRIEPSVDFDWNAIESLAEDNDSISWAEASATLVKLLQWITEPGELAKAGARANLVVYLLNPAECKYGSLRELAEASGCTKQALSEALMDWRRELNLGLNLGKRAYTSESYRQAQDRAFAAGNHASQVLKRRNGKGSLS